MGVRVGVCVVLGVWVCGRVCAWMMFAWVGGGFGWLGADRGENRWVGWGMVRLGGAGLGGVICGGTGLGSGGAGGGGAG